MPTVDLTPRLARESKPSPRDTFLFDRSLPGFGLRIHPSGRKVWIVQARIEGRSRRIVIAGHGEIALAEACRRARGLLARIRAGGNPADDLRREKDTPTFRAFADEYLRRSEPRWKPSGRKTVRIYVKARLLPAFGRMPLDADELARLGRTLDAHEARWPEAVAAIRLLALTGCRRSEVLNLRWQDIGENALNLPDSKTGPRAVPLGKAARAHIGTLPGPHDPDAFLFASYAYGRGYYPLRDCWRAVCADAKLGSLRLHDLRHTATSHAVMSGESLLLVARRQAMRT